MTYEHSDNYLIHHGVKGQKRGFRRYQNEDGSLTAEGRDHYGVGEGNKKVAGKTEKPVSEKKPSSEQDVNKEKSHKAAKIIGGVAAAAAAAALVGYGLKNRSKLKEAASAIRRNAKQTVSSVMGKKKNRALSDNELHKLGIHTVPVHRAKVDRVKIDQTPVQRAQRNLDEIRRLSRERESKMNRIDDQLSRMNRKYGLW